MDAFLSMTGTQVLKRLVKEYNKLFLTFEIFFLVHPDQE